MLFFIISLLRKASVASAGAMTENLTAVRRVLTAARTLTVQPLRPRVHMCVQLVYKWGALWSAPVCSAVDMNM